MTEAKHLAEALSGFLLEEENGWFVPVVSALEGLSAEQAAKVPGERFNSVWGIVNHMTHWMEFLRLRLLNEDPGNLGKDWAVISDPSSEAEWASAKEQMAGVTRKLAEMVEGWPDELLEEPYGEGRPKRYQVIQGVIAHNSYHTNEIISVRHMLGLWLEQT